MLLLHAITAAEAPGPLGPGREANGGLRGYPLRRIEHGGLAAWATAWDEAAPPLDRRDLLASHRLLLGLGDCLPARLPTWVSDEAALEARLSERAAELAATLHRLRGTGELALSVVWRAVPEAADTSRPDADADADAGPGAGTRYLRARQRALAETDQRRARAEALQARLERAAGPRLLAARASVCPSPSVAVRSALLVPRAEAAAVRARLRACLRRADDVRILVNGPWPPYTFVGLGREA